MARHIEAWMDGVRLSDLGDVIIQDVNEPAAEMEVTYSPRSFRSGQNVIKRRRKSLRVTIHAAIHELFDLPRRNQIRQAVAEWCGGTYLELSNHPDQRLKVICKGEPGLGDVREFTSQLNIELEANEIPFWEEKVPSTVTGSGSSGSETLFIPGTAKEVPVEVSFTPGAALESLTVTVSCGGVSRQIALSGMSVTGAITFGRDEHDRITIRSGTTSLLRYRSASSADDLIIPAGQATVTWSASTGGSISFSARGRWL